VAAALSTCVSKTILMEGMSRKEASHPVASGPRPARWACHPLRRDLALLNRHPTMPGLITIPLSYFIGTSPRNNGALSMKSVLLCQAICGTKAATQSRNTKVPKRAKKTVVRREYTKADVKELRAHSKAKTPVVKIAKLTKRSVGSLRQKALKLGIRLGHRR
jgi:hypothetical protein